MLDRIVIPHGGNEKFILPRDVIGCSLQHYYGVIYINVYCPNIKYRIKSKNIDKLIYNFNGIFKYIQQEDKRIKHYYIEPIPKRSTLL